MRFPFASLAAAMHRPFREIERANRVVVVRAPDGWTDVQVEAWLDWADAEGLAADGEDALAEIAVGWGSDLTLTRRVPWRRPCCLDWQRPPGHQGSPSG